MPHIELRPKLVTLWLQYAMCYFHALYVITSLVPVTQATESRQAGFMYNRLSRKNMFVYRLYCRQYVVLKHIFWAALQCELLPMLYRK